MKDTCGLKKYVKKQYDILQRVYENTFTQDYLWLTDNKNRILNICSSMIKGIPSLKLPVGYREVRVLELARELVGQSLGNVNEETVLITKKFRLTGDEYEFLPFALKISLIDMCIRILSDRVGTEYAPAAVKSLILFSDIDFEGLRESCLEQEEYLLKDKTYFNSDNSTRAQYRRKISELSRKSGRSETEVCVKALRSALGSITQNLFLGGKEIFRQSLGVKEKNARTGLKLFAYVLSALLLTLTGIGILWMLPVKTTYKILLSIFSFAPFCVFFVNVINRCILRKIKPQRPMRLKSEFADVKENKTAIALTVMLSKTEDIKKALKTVEEYYLGNRLKYGVYLILGDLKESDREALEEDGSLKEILKKGIGELNKKYGDVFCGVVRNRQKNYKVFSGWERKRGAIEQLVRYITHKEEIPGICINKEILEDVKYICTLDADTVVPPGSVIKLLGVIAHPVNKMVFSGKDVRGYGLVQPMIGNVPDNRTLFGEIMSPTGGIDTYDGVVGEVYNDLFSSGSFCGKGIFSVEGYEKLVSGKIQPNTVLSHDIIEGELLNTKGANDVSFLDEFPQTPIAYYKRRERWLRGDWILFPWLFSKIKPVSRWKIFYNLLQAKFFKDVFLQALIAPFFGVYGYIIWAICLLELSMPTLFAYADALRFDREKHAFTDNRSNRRSSIRRSVLNKLFLPFEFYISTVSMLKGLWRRAFNRKRVLEWNTFASTLGAGSKKEYTEFFMPSIILAIIFYGVCVYTGIGIVTGLIASALWCMTPYFARLLGQKKQRQEEKLLPDETHSLKILAMRTLRFFYEALEDNGYIMPDNLQLKPYKGYARRTSPTNIGFGLMSVPCGLKLGVYSPSFCSISLKKQMEAIRKLDTFRGHLYNWYDLNTQKPLDEYISTVDSGNYCASLIAVAGSIEAIKNRQILLKAECNGIGDLIYSYLDGVEKDFSIHLEEYARDIYNLSGKKAANRLKDLLDDGILSSCDGIEFIQSTVRYWLQDFYGLSFSQKLINKIDETGEFNLRPLKEYLLSFPKSINETLLISDFDCQLEERVWSLGREKYSSLLKEVRDEFRRIYNYAYSVNEQLNEIEKYINGFLDEIDFKCLYDPKKKMLSIGMNGRERSINYYDMLMSEARLTSYIAISLGKIPAEHWFRLSRPFTRALDRPLCLSWSGTMFEYLMPDIFIKPSENSMLSTSSKTAVRAQMNFRHKNGMWGISESAFNALDFSKEYKYKAFGVPETAIATFKAEKVFSPYSTMLAFEYAPRECMDNIVRFVENGGAGIYGMFEAIDCKRVSGDMPGIVFSHMAHHSGMGLCSLVNYLCNGAIRKMFTSHSYISANSVLLEEKMPLGVLPRKELNEDEHTEIRAEVSYQREFISPDKQSEERLVLSGEDVRVEVTSRGSVNIFCGDTFVGEAFVYVRSVKTSSISFLPVKDDTARYKTVFYPEKAVFTFDDGGLFAEMEICVLENREVLWRVKAKNKTDRFVKADIILALKPALNHKDAFASHPYFNGLFIEAEASDKLVFRNRKTGADAVLYTVEGEKAVFETDGMKVLGRGNDFSRPILNIDGEHKKYPITPIMCMMIEACLNDGETGEEEFLLSIGNGVMLKNKAAVNRAVENAGISARAELRAFNVTKEEWLLALKMAILSEKRFKMGEAEPDTLWQYGISDARPLMTVFLPKDFLKEKLRLILKSADTLMSKGFDMQVMIIEDTVGDYLDGAFNYTDREIKALISKDRIYHIKKSNIPESRLDEIKCMSFLYLSLDNDITEQIPKVGQYIPTEKIRLAENKYPQSKNEEFEGEFDNGFGRFINDGKDYYIYKRTPVPWSNVISNESFGTLITESGGGYTWYKNSSLNKLTPWYNDAVTDPLGEALYLRDNKGNRFWSITRDPVDMGDEYSCVFSKGCGIYRYNGFGLEQKQTVFVHKDKSIKVINVEISNISDRDITAYYFLKPVMGESIEKAFKYTKTCNIGGMCCLKRNNEYMFVYAKNAEFCYDQVSFFGNGDTKRPQAVCNGDFVGGSGTEALLALKMKAKDSFDIFVGYAETEEELKKIKTELDNADTLQWLEEVKADWEEKASRIQIKTPDRKLDLLFNNWLYYQTVSSRLQARCGFYQAGGAYGFRDQLQDCLSLIVSEPERVKSHILKCAAHQFSEGDVQHWWHEPYLGVRTRVSDDLLFLPYVASEYAFQNGDSEIFDIQVPFLQGHGLGEREDLYERAWQSDEKASLYEHCKRAIELVMIRSGEHSLPLMLGGDWNDGMNRLGIRGNGESVWLGWFFYSVISKFLPYVKDEEFSKKLIHHAEKLYNALNTVCWDGQWYLRAFDDSGRRIGSKGSECAEIDGISQAWSVLSGAGKNKLVHTAMTSVEKRLVDRENGIVKLLTPPFTKEFGAGYIGDYIPGVRENGGQYTHGAIWIAEAFLESGKIDTGYEILDMINPVSHSCSRSSAIKYKLEPYAVPADIYSNIENMGRGGWNWYTASSSMYYVAVLNELLGIGMENGEPSVAPRIPSFWREFSVKIDTPKYKYDIIVLNPQGRSDTVESITAVKKESTTEIRVVM